MTFKYTDIAGLDLELERLYSEDEVALEDENHEECSRLRYSIASLEHLKCEMLGHNIDCYCHDCM